MQYTLVHKQAGLYISLQPGNHCKFTLAAGGDVGEDLRPQKKLLIKQLEMCYCYIISLKTKSTSGRCFSLNNCLAKVETVGNFTFCQWLRQNAKLSVNLNG